MRFGNELGTRDYVSKRILDNCKKNSNSLIVQYEAYIMINQKMLIYIDQMLIIYKLELLKI